MPCTSWMRGVSVLRHVDEVVDEAGQRPAARRR